LRSMNKLDIESNSENFIDDLFDEVRKKVSSLMVYPMSMSVNIFLSLAKYAERQEENFLTESFVYLLNLMIERECLLATAFLQKLCSEKCKLWFSPLNKVSISTQMTIDTGRPDIIITPDINKIIFIEVKHDSHLGRLQLERYKSYLDSSKYAERQLVLLTRSRHSIQETTLTQEFFHHVCWYEISGWLSDLKITDPVVNYIIHQFLEFLGEKEMTMEKVEWEYMDGVPAMVRLANMLYTAISETLPEEKCGRTAGWNWMGYYVGDNPLFIGFRYNAPLMIVFENNRGTNPTFARELSLSTSHFFSLTAGEQLECLIKFIRDAGSDHTSSVISQ
jgi:hypothetical protein